MSNHKIVAAQRKDLDAALASRKGIRIPRIFPAFDAARDYVLNDGGTIILRSEHPLEQKGLSGLNMSPVVSPEKVALHEKKGGLFASFRSFDVKVLEYMMRDLHTNKWWNARHYCVVNKLDLNEYVSQLVYSYWEYVKGTNLYVVVDPHVPNRYRVFAEWQAMVKGEMDVFTSYGLFDGARLVGGHAPEHVCRQVADIQHFYDQVRSVFGKDMCWVVEMQLTESGVLYFLQRSVGQEFKKADWSFESDEPCHFLLGPKYGYGEVRGITPKEGVDLTFLLERGTRIGWLNGYIPSAIMNAHTDSVVADQQLLNSIQAYINISHQLHGDSICDPHGSILPMVRPPLYLYMPKLHEKLPTDIAAQAKQLQVIKEGGDHDWYAHPEKMVHMTLNVRSDGNEARVNIVKVS